MEQYFDCKYLGGHGDTGAGQEEAVQLPVQCFSSGDLRSRADLE